MGIPLGDALEIYKMTADHVNCLKGSELKDLNLLFISSEQ